MCLRVLQTEYNQPQPKTAEPAHMAGLRMTKSVKRVAGFASGLQLAKTENSRTRPSACAQNDPPQGYIKKAKATPTWDRLCLIGSEPNYFVASLTFSAAAFTASAAFCAASTPASTFSAVSTTCSATSSTLVCSQASASSHSVQSASVHSSAASTTSTASSATASASAAG